MQTLPLISSQYVHRHEHFFFQRTQMKHKDLDWETRLPPVTPIWNHWAFEVALVAILFLLGSLLF